MRKIDKFFTVIWVVFIPIIVAFIILLMNFDLYILMDDELVSLWVSVISIVSIVYLSGWIINLVWSFIVFVKDKIHDKRLAKFYKEHPEEEQKNREALAKDFEELAKIIREGEKRKGKCRERDY